MKQVNKIETETTTTQQKFLALKHKLSEKIIGQDKLVLSLLIALVADGHILVEGVPGIAKTTAIKTLASLVDTNFQRVQFTPDLLPADITGTEIYDMKKGEFVFREGPLFNSIILADEINRAPAKVQSALLEAMGERQITIGLETYSLPSLFLVMATQNPLDNHGTHPLPEAQKDRFLLHVNMLYPSDEHEVMILRESRRQSMEKKLEKEQPIIHPKDVMIARQELFNIHLSETVEHYITNIIIASRSPAKFSKKLSRYITLGASPRGTFALEKAARAYAYLENRDYVTPSDVQSIAELVLRHRLILSYEADSDDLSVEHIISDLLQHVATP